MKIKIDTTLNCIEAKDTVVGKVYSVSSIGSPMLRISLCTLHENASVERIAFLRLNETDVCTILYPPNQKMFYIGDPTLTIE
jgi:hypothetical protein